VNAAVVAVLLAAPVVKLGPGSGVVLHDGLIVTTHQVVAGTARPIATLEDGGTAAIGRALVDDEERDLALVLVEGDLEPARLSAGVPDAGTHLTVWTGSKSYEAIAGAASSGVYAIEVPDAGEVRGAALLDEGGTVWGVVRDDRTAFSPAMLADVLDAFLGRSRPADHRYRNLGISAAFFLGLSVWWVYRSKRSRY